MAPPRHRRPGFSRKARFGLFAGYVAAVSGVLVGLVLVAIARLDPSGFAAIRGGALDATAPVSAVGRVVVERVAGLDDAVFAYVDAGRQNAELRAENVVARRRLIEARAIMGENARLRALLRLADDEPARIATVRVVGSTASGSRRLVTITAGRAQGVFPGQAVRAPEGLVGRVLESGTHAARVLLLTDAENSVPVRIVRNGQPALATGRGDGRVVIRPLIAGPAPFHRGDLAVTSGVGGLYPPGVPVAVIGSVDRDGALAWPLADPARLDFALVLDAYEAPPAPAPVAAPAPDAR